MRCEMCQGTRLVRGSHIVNYGTPLARETKLTIPCPDCLGGETHCCEGLCEQPEPEETK